MAQTEEWDWPPPRRSRAEQIDLDSRIVEEQIVLPRQVPNRRGFHRRGQPAGLVETILVTILKFAVAIPVALIVLSALWVLSAILKA